MGGSSSKQVVYRDPDVENALAKKDPIVHQVQFAGPGAAVAEDFRPYSTAIDMRNDGELNEDRYAQIRTEPLSRGNVARYGFSQYTVYFAFLEYDNDEFFEPSSVRDTMFPMNYFATLLGCTDVIHVQVVFWDDARQLFFTFSVDSHNGVSVQSRKYFARKGWRFYELHVSEQQELAMYNFCVSQLHKPFSRWGVIMLYFFPFSTNGRSYFCSEFCIETMRVGGIGTTWARRACQVPPHEFEEYLNICTDVVIVKLGSNIVQCELLDSERRKADLYNNRPLPRLPF